MPSVSPAAGGGSIVVRSWLPRALHTVRARWETLRHSGSNDNQPVVRRITAADTATIGLTDSLSFQLTYGGRGWGEMWHRMVRAHSDLAAIYASSTPANSTDDWKDTTGQFFLVCHHLADWINKDVSVPAAARSDVWNYVRADSDLSLAQDFSNTLKHLERKSPQDRTVYVDVVSGGDTRPSLTLAWDVGGQRQGTRDALDLADACMVNWRSFLSKHHMSAP